MLTMALPFWRACSKILSTDHEDSGTGVPMARGGGWRHRESSTRRPCWEAAMNCEVADDQPQPLVFVRLQHLAQNVSAGLRPFPRTNAAWPRCPAGKAAAGFGDPDTSGSTSALDGATQAQLGGAERVCNRRLRPLCRGLAARQGAAEPPRQFFGAADPALRGRRSEGVRPGSGRCRSRETVEPPAHRLVLEQDRDGGGDPRFARGAAGARRRAAAADRQHLRGARRKSAWRLRSAWKT